MIDHDELNRKIAEIARLRRAIEEAPHGIGQGGRCILHETPSGRKVQRCYCWKRDAMGK